MQAKYVLTAALIIGLAAALVPALAQTPAATSFPVNVTDDLGVTTTVARAPERIVSLSPANTELLFELGVGGKIVGVDSYSNYPAAANNITRVSGFSEINYEAITAAKPDLIFVEDIIGETAVTRLRGMGFPVIELKYSNITMLKKNIGLLGQATGTSANATGIIASIDTVAAQMQSRAAALKLAQKPNVLLVTGLYGDETIYPFGNGTYGDELIRLAGGRNAAGNITQFGVMSHEAIIAEDPDVIIIPVDAISAPYVQAFQNGSMAWANGLKAVRTGQVYTVDADVVNRPPQIALTGLMIANVFTEYAANMTATATPGASPKASPTPGFEAMLALAGLLGVATFIARKAR